MTIRSFRDAVVGLWREGPDLLAAWLDGLADDLNRWTGKHRWEAGAPCICGHDFRWHLAPGGCCIGDCDCLFEPDPRQLPTPTLAARRGTAETGDDDE